MAKASRESVLFPGNVTALVPEVLRKWSSSNTHLFLLDRILCTVLEWVWSDSRYFLLAWPGMPHLHEEGLGGAASTGLMATILPVEG